MSSLFTKYIYKPVGRLRYRKPKVLSANLKDFLGTEERTTDHVTELVKCKICGTLNGSNPCPFCCREQKTLLCHPSLLKS